MKLTITLPDGRTATVDGTKWSSADPRLATYCTIATATEAASYLPHPFLESAKRLAAELGGTLEIEGAASEPKEGEIH
jgi:hypothetical protein